MYCRPDNKEANVLQAARNEKQIVGDGPSSWIFKHEAGLLLCLMPAKG